MFRPTMCCLISLLIWAAPGRADDLSEADKSLIDLVKNLAQDPHLMDAGYLSNKLGVPETPWAGGGSAQKIWNWCEPINHTMLAKLEKSVSDDGISESKFTAFAPGDSRIPPNALESIFGKVVGQNYDNRIFEASKFAISDNTTVTALVPPNGFNVKELQVEYKGAVLPPLSREEANASLDERRKRAFDLLQAGHPDQALPLLVRHMQVRPADAEARAKLAECYKERCCLNQAIEQYWLALKHAGDDESVRQSCIQGLQSLKVIPRSDSMPSDNDAAALVSHEGNSENCVIKLKNQPKSRSSVKPSKTASNMSAALLFPDKADDVVVPVAAKGNPLDPGF